jgi:hypothetical protein
LLTSELWYCNWIACNWESWIKNRGWSSSQVFRASPMVLSMWLQRVKFIVKKAKCASSLALRKLISLAPTSCSLPVAAGKRHNIVVHLHKRV